jgi:NADH:ubiquinone oxidoreductase subunit 5 (subunit L)/multisubunit Na+/H+ antiporter MnhA subunit
LLAGSALLTGLYTGRLFFGVFYGPEREAAHHVHKPDGLLIWPLVPLAIGAVTFGYLEAGTHMLSSLVKGAVVMAEVPQVHMISGLGLGLFAIGLVGFALSYVAVLGNRALPAPAGSLVGALWDEVKALPAGVAGAQTGRLGRYVFITLVGTVVMLVLGLRS